MTLLLQLACSGEDPTPVDSDTDTGQAPELPDGVVLDAPVACPFHAATVSYVEVGL